MSSKTFQIEQQHLETFTQSFAKDLRKGDVVALWGDLGVGKTTLARSVIRALMGEAIDVPSPTFTLVQVYETSLGEVWHCDLYRLKNSQEVFELGLEDAFHGAICLIEWPERLENLLPQKRIDVSLRIIDETTREITITTIGDHENFPSCC